MIVFANWDPGNPPWEMQAVACLLVGGGLVLIVLAIMLIAWLIAKGFCLIMDEYSRSY